jgi:DHA1 family inner membrane transport protein
LPLVVFALAACGFAVGTQAFAFVGLIAEMAADLRTSLGATGKLVAVYALVFAFAAPLIATRTVTLERRGAMTFGLGVVAAANAAAAFAPDVWTLTGLRVAAALGAAIVAPLATTSAATAVPPERRGRALAVVTGGITLAFLVGIPLGAAIGGSFGWRAIFLFAAALALAAMAIVRLGAPRLAPSSASGGLAALAAMMRDPRVLPVAATTALAFAAMFNINAFIGPITTALTGATGARVGFFQAFIGVGALVGVPLGGLLADRGRPAAAMGALAVQAAALAFYALLLARADGALPWPALSLAVVTAATALFTLVPILQARLVAAAGPLAPVALALNGAALSLGQGLGAAVGGLVIEAVGLWAVGLSGAAFALVGAALVALWARR